MFDELCDDIGNDERVVACEFFNVDGVVFDAFFIRGVDEGVDEVAFFLHHECGGCEFVDDVDVEVFAHCGQDGVSDPDSGVFVAVVVWVVPVFKSVFVTCLLGGFFGDGFKHGSEDGAVGVFGGDFHAGECGRSCSLLESEDDSFGLVVFGVPGDDVFAVAKEGVVACFAGCVFCSFSIGVDVDFVGLGCDSVVVEKCLRVGGDLGGVFLELVVDDNGVEVVVFVFHCEGECEGVASS